MTTLTVDAYMHLPMADREQIDKWLRAHTVEPFDCFQIDNGAHTVTAHLYRKHGTRVALKAGQPETFTVQIVPKYPFPLELEDQ